MKNRIFLLLLTILVLLFAAACASPANDPDGIHSSDTPPPYEDLTEPSVVDIDRFFELTEAPDIPDVPVATLGEYTVLRSDYAFFFYQLRSNIEYSMIMDPLSEEEMAEFWDFEIDENGTTAREYLKTTALDAAKELAIIHTLAVSRGVQPDEMADQQSDFDVLSMLSQYNSDEQDFADFFQMTSQQLRGAYRRMNLMLKYMDEAMQEFTVTEEEIRAVFDAAPDYYNAATIRHVFITCTDDMSPEEQSIARLTADEIFEMLQGGTDIGELAYYYSEDSDSRYQNGEYTFVRGQIAQELEEWAFSAKQGDQDLIKTDYGYHIVELIAPAGYESAREEIEYDLRAGMFYQSLEKELELVSSPDWVLDQAAIDSITV